MTKAAEHGLQFGLPGSRMQPAPPPQQPLGALPFMARSLAAPTAPPALSWQVPDGHNTSPMVASFSRPMEPMSRTAAATAALIATPALQAKFGGLTAADVQHTADDHNDDAAFSFRSDDDISITSGFSELEEMENIEDLLLQELFFPGSSKTKVQGPKQAAQPTSAAIASLDGPEHHTAHPVPSSSPEAAMQDEVKPKATLAAGSHGPLVNVAFLAVQDVKTAQGQPAKVVRAVTKAAKDEAGSKEVYFDCSQNPINAETVLDDPLCLDHAHMPNDVPQLVIELWEHKEGQHIQQQPEQQQPAFQLDQLLGIVRVPLDAPACNASSPLQLDSSDVLASGAFEVWDLLRGRANGLVEIIVTCVSADLPVDRHDVDERDSQGPKGTTADDGSAVQPAVVAVEHTFEVTVHSASHLPGSSELQEAQQLVPTSRFISYSFPGTASTSWTLCICRADQCCISQNLLQQSHVALWPICQMA